MTLNNAFAARTCIVGVVVTNESNMASYFPEAEILMAVMLTCIRMWLDRRVAARDICLIQMTLDLSLDPVLLLFSPLLARTTNCHLEFERDYNYYTVFPGVLRRYA